MKKKKRENVDRVPLAIISIVSIVSLATIELLVIVTYLRYDAKEKIDRDESRKINNNSQFYPFRVLTHLLRIKSNRYFFLNYEGEKM